MDMRPVIEAAVQELMRSPGDTTTHADEVRGIMTGLDVGVRDVELVEGSSDSVGLRIVMDKDWEPLDESWGPEDSVTAMFNAMELAGYRHVPGTSRFLPNGSTSFVKDGITFDFAPPQLDEWET